MLPALISYSLLACSLLAVLCCALWSLVRQGARQARQERARWNALLTAQAPILRRHTAVSQDEPAGVPTASTSAEARCVPSSRGTEETAVSDDTWGWLSRPGSHTELSPPLLQSPPSIASEPVLGASPIAWEDLSSPVPMEPAADRETAMRDTQPRAIFQATGFIADPVDGLPFAPGELLAHCVCGTGYRLDTVQWLRDMTDGLCVHCGQSTFKAP